ncbi:MAG: 3-deoxy-7-phosphoheptulonate synthase [Myxococcota bacterium]
MIIVMKADIAPESKETANVLALARGYPSIEAEVRAIQGASRCLTEIYLLGPTQSVPTQPFEDHPAVERAIRIHTKYRHIGRHDGQVDDIGFDYQGLTFNQQSFHIFAGLCAVDERKNVELMFKSLKRAGLTTTRAGAYKPRTSPYDFQGHGARCLPYLFELAGTYGIKIISMEVTHESHVDEILRALEGSGHATGVMLQIGTRNAQNFELLKRVGCQNELPVLFKRGMGITLEESLNACEYLASAGNQRLIFCLRGMKTNLGDPHRNFVDFAHVPVLKRQTRLPVCIDPSHAVGKKLRGNDGLLDIHHATAQGIIAGANMVLVDFHPDPEHAMCDGPQALRPDELEHFVADCRLAKECYDARRALAAQYANA